MRRRVISGWIGGMLAAAPLGAQSLKISVTNQATKQSVPNATVVLRDSLQATLQTVVSDPDGIALFRLPAAGLYYVTAKRIGYLPAPSKAARIATGERVTLGLIMTPVPVSLDTVLTRDRAEAAALKLTTGEEFFRRHAELGKGHFFLGPQIKKSGLSVTEFLVANLDSLTFIGASPHPPPPPKNSNFGLPTGTPVIPAARKGYLAGKHGAQCLYARIDRFDIYALLVWNQKHDIDELLSVDEIVGVEIFQDYSDVPKEWKGDAIAPERIEYVNAMGNHFNIGRIGLGARIDSAGDYRSPELGHGNDPPTFMPKCPFLQIWTNVAW